MVSDDPYQRMHNDPAERAVLGAMLMERDAIFVVRDLGMIATDFYAPVHAKIFRAIMDDFAADSGGVGPVDHVTLYDLLQKRDKLDEVGGISYLITIQGDCPTAAGISRYAAIVLEHSHRRQALDALAVAKGQLLDFADLSECLGHLQERLCRLLPG